MREMTIGAIHRAYQAGELTPGELLRDCLAKARDDRHQSWISLISDEQLTAALARLDGHSPADMPLYGIPFAIKDNIDLAGLPTTAACREFAYQPDHSAFVVEQLLAAGAIPLGKTNLDQFATGLVGVRSPYGACHNSFNPDYVSGGSSAGSSVAVALGQVSFSLGTDTAGSGRVPAAFNNLVGLKGTRGRISCSGVVPACRSLDCVTLFALTASDAARVWAVAAEFDPADPFARPAQAGPLLGARFRFGVPSAEQLAFFGDDAAAALFAKASQTLEALGGVAVTIDFAPFLQAAKLLYEGPWVAERLAAIKAFFKADPSRCLPVIQTIIGGAERHSAVAAFEALYQLQALKRRADAELAKVELVLTPTTGTIYTIAELEAEPIALNSNLGHYTNFMNLLDYCAIALPAGFRGEGPKAGLPFGITLFAPRYADNALLALGERWQRAQALPLGATGLPFVARDLPQPDASSECIDVLVCGAHLDGLPLNVQLRERGAVLVEQTVTAPCYRFYRIAGGAPLRPALVRDEHGEGRSIEVEIWRLPLAHFGSFVAGIPAPLGIGKVELADGRRVCGFISEPCALQGAEEITAHGGWRAYLATLG